MLSPTLRQRDLNNEISAYFIRCGNVVSTETCKLTIDDDIQSHNRQITISIADGNHSNDFDRVDIVKDTSVTLISLFLTFDQYRQGYGTIDTTIEFPISRNSI